MRVARSVIFSLALALGLVALLAASFPHQVVGLSVAAFEDRDVLVIRTSGDVPPPAAYKRDPAGATLSFVLRSVGARDVGSPAESTALIRSVAVDRANPDGTAFTVTLSDAKLVSPDYFRFSQPSEHVILLEIFPESGAKQDAGPMLDIETRLPLTGEEQGQQTPAADTSLPAASAAPTFDPDQLGITTLDLSTAEPSRVMGLAAATGLLNMKGAARVATEELGELKIKPAGQSAANWVGATPPGELYLVGSERQIAEFLRRADPKLLQSQPTLEQFWAANQPKLSLRSVGNGTSPDTRSRLRDDPAAGLYYDDFVPGGKRLSDVLVSLPAMSGMNLYDVLNYLSLISGISLIIDPYAFEEPTGSVREPIVPEPPEANSDEPGFRPAGIFDPQLDRGGSVQGNFVDVPFDTALRMILDIHELEFVIYTGDGAESGGGSRYGSYSGGDKDKGRSGEYEKPVVLVTSRERLNQELEGSNEIDLYQLHYADATQVTQIMDNLNLRPGTNSGWYIYSGGGYGNGGAGGGTGGGGGGNNGGGGGYGGGGAGGGRAAAAFASPQLLVYRGSSRQPVYDAVSAAVAKGQSVIRVKLAPEASGMYVTALAQP